MGLPGSFQKAQKAQSEIPAQPQCELQIGASLLREVQVRPQGETLAQHHRETSAHQLHCLKSWIW